MPRLPKIMDDEASEEVGRVFDGAKELLGFVSNSTRTVAHSPGWQNGSSRSPRRSSVKAEACSTRRRRNSPSSAHRW